MSDGDGDDGDRSEGDACPSCGALFDPGVDIEGCENCRQLVLSESEKSPESVEPDPEELAAVTRFQRFLKQSPDASYHYCPGCLGEFRPEAKGCLKCTKDLLSAEDAWAFASRTVEDLTASWFVPLMDDSAEAFAEAVLDTIESDPGPPVELRVKRHHRDFSPILGVWRSYRSQYFVRRMHLGLVRSRLALADLPEEHTERLEALLAHLDSLIAPP